MLTVRKDLFHLLLRQQASQDKSDRNEIQRKKNNYGSICYFNTADRAMDLSITSPVSPLIQITDFRSMIRVIGSSLHNPQIEDQ